jgi:hypothetical protein
LESGSGALEERHSLLSKQDKELPAKQNRGQGYVQLSVGILLHPKVKKVLTGFESAKDLNYERTKLPY